MKEEWLLPGAVVPVDAETTAALIAEIRRLISVVGAQALRRAAWSSITEEEREALLGFHSGVDGNICAEEALDMLRAHEEQLREKNA